MKTTIDLPDELLRAAQELARREGTTLKALVESGLRGVIATQRGGGHEFVLADASVDGQGMTEDFRGAGWAQVRDAAYG
ncbi:MAG: type II toxin-antitoxin system VapB family antitoxin [Thermocrispum sp.]